MPKPRLKRSIETLICLVLLTSGAARADEVVRMKNGDIYRGKIVQHEREKFVQIRLKDGNEKRLQWPEIEGILNEDRPREGLSGAGEVLFGSPSPSGRFRQEYILSATKASFVFSENGHDIQIAVAYRYAVIPEVQLGYQVGWQHTKSANVLVFLVGPTFNLGVDEETGFAKAFFLSVGAGLTVVDTTTSSGTEFTFGAELGKRIAVTSHLTYQPSVSFVKISGAVALFGITPLAFGLVF
jgi:hypothetical protein